MNYANKLNRKIEKTALEIAKESASFDPEAKCWWGHDTDIGDLPFRIKKKLSALIDWTLWEQEKRIIKLEKAVAPKEATP